MDRERFLKFANTSASAQKLEAMIRVAKPDVAVTADMLDRGSFLLNCQNGTIDLTSGQLQRHRQNDFITKLAPVIFDERARAPRFEQFLQETFNGSADLIRFVQIALGYSLTGSVKEQKLFIAHGAGDNGKSTLFGAIREILGDYSLETDPTLLIRKRQEGPSEDVYGLRGVRLATTMESDEDVTLNEARMKQLTGGDRLTARPLHGHFESFDPSHKLWLITNHLPRIKGQGHSIWRRIRLVPFAVKVPAVKKDRSLPDKLRAEYPGMLTWLLEGCLMWQQEGLPEPPEVMHATMQYQEEEDSLSDFIQDRCQLGPDFWVQSSKLRDAYKDWCRANNEVPVSRNAFGARMKEKGFVTKDTNTCNMWLGIAVKSDQPVRVIRWEDLC